VTDEVSAARAAVNVTWFTPIFGVFGWRLQQLAGWNGSDGPPPDGTCGLERRFRLTAEHCAVLPLERLRA